MAPPDKPIDIFLHGRPVDWLTHAGGISSLVVAPVVMLIGVVFWLWRMPLGRWAWLLCALPALVAAAEFYFELRRIQADIDQVWSRDWNFNSIYAEAYARLYLGIAFTLLFLLSALLARLFRHAPTIA
jgi:hypothetical protein